MSNRVSNEISDDTLNRIIQIESAGNPSIKAKTSTATGLGQFLNATWLNLVNKYHREWWTGRTKNQVLDLRKNPSLNIELLARLTEENARIVGTTTGGDLYLAHFLGPADAKDLFRAAPNALVTSLVSDAVVSANRSIMLNKDGTSKTAADVRAWAKRKMSKPAPDWVGKFYTGKGPDPKRVVPKDEPSPVDEDTKGSAVEKPEPPEPPRPDPVPEVTPAPEPEKPKEREGFGGWLGRQWKAVSAWVSGLTSTGILAYLTDWKVVATLGAIAVALVLIAFFIWKATHK